MAGMIDKLAMWLAWRLPRRVVSWAFVRVMAHATTGPYSDTILPELEGAEALRRWDAFDAPCGASDGYGTCERPYGHNGPHLEKRYGQVWAAWGP